MPQPGFTRGAEPKPTGGRGGWDPDLLVDLFARRVYRFLVAMTRDQEAAADLTQDTFLKIHSVRAQFGESPPSAAFVLTVARNTAISWMRRRTFEQHHFTALPTDTLQALAPAGESSAPDRELCRRELQADLLAALATLPADLREVFLLSEVEGLTYAEIAAAVGCPAGTVASRKHNAVQKLREHLGRSGHAM
jgi:RNA polymerase sigma-70 factor (ECF subfamily)